MKIQEVYASALEHHRAGRRSETETLCRELISQRPDIAEFHNLLGVSLQGQSRVNEAIECYRAAAKLRPQFAAAHYNLGTLLRVRGHVDESILELKQATVLDPDFFAAWNNLGNAYEDRLDFALAADAYRQAMRLEPKSAQTNFNLANALRDMADPDGAIAAYQKAIELKSDYVEAQHNLAAVLKDTGRLDEAIQIWQRLLESHPDPFIESNYIYSLHFDPDYDAKKLYQAHARWNQRYAGALAPQMPVFPNARDPNRGSTPSTNSVQAGSPQGRLRIGYVSPDLREHPVGRFLHSLLSHHDRGNFEIFCYTDLQHADALTARLKSHTDIWRSTVGLSDEQLAQLVRQDRIDILVDLTMHMRGSRLLAFARKPAPVQVTYLAYCGTTGLETMDYRLTDAYLDPVGSDESVYSEKSVRLRSYWCYEAPSDSPAVEMPPCLKSGTITFGCLNNFNKITPATLDVWARVMQVVPNSRLILYSSPGSHRQRTCEQVARNNINANRLEFVPLMRLNEYLAQYHQIDIALDPFPYPGGTTTCDALWMGVPVITLAGQTAVSRAGVSILSNVGLSELVARTTEEYVEAAAALAVDPRRLAELRSSLRQRMRTSPLMDARAFTVDIENAFRAMWKTWCAV